MDVHKFIPIKNIVGPGSQVDDFAEGQLEYLSMPQQMQTFSQPILPEPDEVQDTQGALDALQQAVVMLKQYQADSDDMQIDVSDLVPGSMALVNQLLGVGEVSAMITTNPRVEIQESVMAGLWRVRYFDENNVIVRDLIEIGSIPSAVRALSFLNASDAVDARLDNLPEHTINSPSILTELKARGLQYSVGEQPLVVNLSLLPLSEQDVVVLGERLGVGPVTILSRGYGNCRIGSTACKNVWWIKYFNSDDSLILNTIEVVNVPDVARADAEDIADSALRLSEMVDIYL